MVTLGHTPGHNRGTARHDHVLSLPRLLTSIIVTCSNSCAAGPTLLYPKCSLSLLFFSCFSHAAPSPPLPDAMLTHTHWSFPESNTLVMGRGTRQVKVCDICVYLYPVLRKFWCARGMRLTRHQPGLRRRHKRGTISRRQRVLQTDSYHQ